MKNGLSIGIGILLVACILGAVVACKKGPTAQKQESDNALAEMRRIEAAIEEFKKQRGYYPLCFGFRNATDFEMFDAFYKGNKNKRVSPRESNIEIREGDFAVNSGELPTNLSVNDEGNVELQRYYFKSAHEKVELLDIYTLDPAESLVFWLGGFPTPCDASGKPVAKRRLFGFNQDPNFSFVRGSKKDEGADPLRLRTKSFYEFAEDRLTDADDDGWLEYRLTSNEQAPPLIYFDGDTLRFSLLSDDLIGSIGYPIERDALSFTETPMPKHVKQREAWGIARPYLVKLDLENPERAIWQRIDSYQLISAGPDHRYGSRTTQPRFVELPSGTTHHWEPALKYQKAAAFMTTGLDPVEADNLTNLLPMAIGEAARSTR